MVPQASSATARRLSLSGDGVHGEEWALGPRRRVDELEAAVARLRAEKEAAERAAAAVKAELESEQGAAETAAVEAMLMIGRLQREKAAAMIEAREFRRIAEGHAGRDRELQDQLAAVSAVAASYLALLGAHGVDPDENEGDDESNRQEERAIKEPGLNGDDNLQAKGEVEDPSPSPPPNTPPAAEEFKYAVDVRCAAVTVPKPAARVAVSLCARVAALEADSVAVRREVAALRADSAAVRRDVAALRAERAWVALAQEVARRLGRDAAAARAVVVEGQKQRFSVLAIFKCFFSEILWGPNRGASTTPKI